jgi:hypothetical protein
MDNRTENIVVASVVTENGSPPDRSQCGHISGNGSDEIFDMVNSGHHPFGVGTSSRVCCTAVCVVDDNLSLIGRLPRDGVLSLS